MPFRDLVFHFLKKREVDVVYCTVIGHFCEAQALEQIVSRLNNGAGRQTILINKTGLPPMTGLNAEYYGFGAGPAVRRLHVVSQQNKEAFVSWQGRDEKVEHFIEVLCEGVDLSCFQSSPQRRNQARRQWQIEPGQVLVTCTSRFYVTKGHDNLLLAAQEAVRENPSLRFVLAGTGSEIERVKRLQEHLRPEGRCALSRPAQ